MKFLLLLCIAVIILVCEASIGGYGNRGLIKLGKFPSLQKAKSMSTPIKRDMIVHSRGGAVGLDIPSSIQAVQSYSGVAVDIFKNYLLSPWLKTPPMTKLFVGLSFLVTSIAAIFNQNDWPEFLSFDWEKTFGEFQLWRPLTSFLYFGPLSFNYLLTMQFMWMYMSQLEKLMYQTPAQYLVMLAFGASSLIGSYLTLGFPYEYLGHNLASYLVYIWSKVFEGTDVSLMDIITLKAEYLPLLFAAQTLLLEGEIPYMDILGVGIGWVYQILHSSENPLIKLPTEWLSKWVFATPIIKKIYEAVGGAEFNS